MIRATHFESFMVVLFSWCSWHIERVDVFFRDKLFLYSLFSKDANWSSLFASQVVFEVVTSGHSGYVAIDEVKVLGHPCSKYLSCAVKPDPVK